MLKLTKNVKRYGKGMKIDMKFLMLVLTGSIYGLMLFVSSICSAANYPTRTGTALSYDLSMNQHSLTDLTDIVTKGPWADVRAYASINAAVTAIGATQTTLLVPNAQTLTASLTIPSTLTLKILKGGSIVKASTYTLTINGPFETGLYKVFSGFSNGGVTFGKGSVKEFYCEWWAENTTPGTTDMTGAIQYALTAMADVNGKLKMLPQTYAISSTISLTEKFEWTWEGAASGFSGQSTKLIWTGGAANGTMFIAAGCRWVKINDITFDGNNSAGIAVQFRNSSAAASDLMSRNLFAINIKGTPGVGLYIGEGDATPGIAVINMYNYQCWDSIEGVRINNGGGQNITFYGGVMIGLTYGIHFLYGGFVEVHDMDMGNNTCHFYMPSGSKLDVFGGYFEEGTLINWGNHNGYGINLIGVLSTHSGVSDVITYGGGDLYINSIGNRFWKAINVAPRKGLFSLNDSFAFGGWTKNAYSTIIANGTIALGTDFNIDSSGGISRMAPQSVVTFPNNSATPSVSGSNSFECQYTAATSITDFLNGKDGQLITIRFGTGNATIVHNLAKIRLKGGVNANPAADNVMSFMLSGVWYEVSRNF